MIKITMLNYMLVRTRVYVCEIKINIENKEKFLLYNLINALFFQIYFK